MKQIESRLRALTLLLIGMVLSSTAWADGVHQLTVVAKPAMAGSFNQSAAELVAGETVHLYAYTNVNFTFVQWTDETGAVVSKQTDFIYTMPERDIQLTAEYEYNPSNPANPARNYWNMELGEVIIDDFTTGQLQNAVRTAIGDNNANDVMMMSVAGVMNSNDFGIANNYSSCTLLDLSRVTGINAVPSYAFDYTNLESVYLPATIETIGYRAFYECRQLSSLILYAMTPPTLENNVFQGVPDGLVVYVPAAAIAQYQDATGWKDFTLLPIQEDIRNLSISLPEGASAQDYAKMWLELTNTKSGQRMHYVITDRTEYVFGNIIRNTSWNVVLRNEHGDVFGKIDNVEVKDEDVKVSFISLSKPQSVVLTVVTPEGQNVTAQTQVTWTDASGNYLAQGTSLTGLPVGYQASYRVMLTQELAMVYATPQQVDYVLTDGDNNITCQLSAIPRVQVSGKVKDVATGLPISGATISASQTFGGKYSKTLNTKTDGNGVFTMEIANVPTTVAVAASDYISQTLDFSNNEFDGLSEFPVPDVLLKPIVGATISVGFTYTTVEGETQSWYSDYQNVSYSLFNVTKNRAISQYNVQYPQIVLLEEVEDGDELRLTATSRTNSFKTVEATATIVEQRAETTFAITELGRIQASFSKTGNASVVGSLYDASGKLLKTYDYSNALLTISDLADGQYTLVSMGSSRLFNTIYDIVQLPQTGLSEGTDYVKNTVEVRSGAISQINIAEVPTLDESKLYYTGDNISFTVNKPSIVAGNYLTLTGRIDFKPAYATSVSNVQMIVDLPESCQFVENSVMVGNSTSSYTLNDHQITIPMTRYTDRVRFCVIPTLGGEYAPSAFAQFDLDGETITQPIGSANYTTKDLSISVPSTVAKTAVPVSGTAIGASNVEIYDNGVLIGQTTSLANGTWATTCELDEPYNLSTHSIYAKVTTKAGLELHSETVVCQYDMNAIQVSKVIMYHDNPELHKTYELTFDFLNPSDKTENYIYYIYNKKFTFTIDFTVNDTTKVSDVVLYVKTAKSGWHPLEATFDTKKGLWVAAGEFGNMYDGDLPVNVKVGYASEIEPIIDMNYVYDTYAIIGNIASNMQSIIEETDSLYQLDLEPEEFEALLRNNDEEEDDTLSVLPLSYYESLTDAELDALLLEIDNNDEELLTSSIEHIIQEIKGLYSEDKYFEITFSDGTSLKSKNTEGIDFSTLEEKGFNKYTTNHGFVYVLSEKGVSEFIDIKSNIHFILTYNVASDSESRKITSKELEEDLDKFNDLIEQLYACYQPIADAYEETEELLGSFVEKARKALADANKNLVQSKTRYFMKKAKLERLESELAAMTTNDGNYYLKKLQVDTYKDEVKAAKKMLNSAKRSQSLAKNAFGLIKPLKGVFTKALPLTKYADVIYTGVSTVRKFQKIYMSVPIPCPEDEQEADKCRKGTIVAAVGAGGAMLVKVGASALADLATVGQIAAAAETGGVTVVTAVATVCANIALNLLIDAAFDKFVGWETKTIKKKIKALECYKDDDDDDDNEDDSNNKDKGFGIDPSGYVYEGVFSNRVEGVTATAYYKEMIEDMYGDLHENIVKWEAEEYAQENPLFTDENGYYRWDVPQGLWQVKFEKEGYETTYSEWLPVPPPQLDVNIAMKQNVQPTVKLARAFEDAVEVEFDKYMIPELLTTDNIIVMQGNEAVTGSVELLNNEASYEGSSETFASKVRFNAAQPFTEQEITLMVNNRVKSYAGIRMQDDYQQAFTIEQEIKQIVSDSLTVVGYGEKATLTVSVLPASASKGKTLNVKTSSPMILGVETEQVVISNDGKAEITVFGELPGTAALTFTVEETDKTALTIASVEQMVYKTVATPTASIASGSTVDKGTAVELSCETEGATIYYTTDGSCPCDETGSRKVYDGTPIIINESVTIKAIATAKDMVDSDVAEFVYIVDTTTGIEEQAQGNLVQLWPLPVHNILNVTAGGNTIKNVTVSSINGIQVAASNSTATKVALDLSSIEAGIYIVNITTVDGVYCRKILKVE